MLHDVVSASYKGGYRPRLPSTTANAAALTSRRICGAGASSKSFATSTSFASSELTRNWALCHGLMRLMWHLKRSMPWLPARRSQIG